MNRYRHHIRRWTRRLSLITAETLRTLIAGTLILLFVAVCLFTLVAPDLAGAKLVLPYVAQAVLLCLGYYFGRRERS